MSVRCAHREFGRDNDPVLGIDRRLAVVALLEGAIAMLHDSTIRIGEVLLRLVLWDTKVTLPGPFFGVPSGLRGRRSSSSLRPFSRSASRWRCSNRALAAAIVARRFSRRVISSGMSNSGSLRSASSAVCRLRSRHQLIDLRPELLFGLTHPSVTHRLVPARIRFDLCAVDRDGTQFHKPTLLSQTHHLHEQLGELFEVIGPKITQRAMRREIAGRQHPKCHVLVQLARKFT
jgi:hypothetical protein